MKRRQPKRVAIVAGQFEIGQDDRVEHRPAAGRPDCHKFALVVSCDRSTESLGHEARVDAAVGDVSARRKGYAYLVTAEALRFQLPAELRKVGGVETVGRSKHNIDPTG